MDSMIVARAQVSIILGLPVPDEYVMRFQTSIVPMPCVSPPGQTLVPQYTTCADASASADWNFDTAEFLPHSYLQNACRDFLWTPLSALKFNPSAKEFIPRDYNPCKALVKRLCPTAKPFVPGQLWLDAVVETPASPTLTVRWEVINKVFARIVKQVEALDITVTTTVPCRALVRQSNRAVLVVQPSATLTLNPLATEFVPAPKNAITSVVRRLSACAPTFVPWGPFLLRALWWYRTLVLAAAYFMSLPNTCTEIIRRPSPLAKTFTPIKDMIISYHESIVDLILHGALVAVKVVSFESAVPIGPTQLTKPTLRLRSFVSSLCFALPSILKMEWNGNNSTAQLAVLSDDLPGIEAASDVLPVVRAPLRDVPVGVAIVTGLQLDVDDFAGILRSLVVSVLAAPTKALPELEEPEELETTAGPLIVDSATYVDEILEVAEDDYEDEVSGPDAPLELPPRPSSPNPDNWDRETIFAAEDESEVMAPTNIDYDKSFVFGFPNMTIVDIPHDLERDIYPTTHLPKPFRQLCEEDFGPSEKQLDSDYDGWPALQKIVQPPLGHHLNFFGKSVPCKSDTSPAKSLAIIFSTPKPELAPNATDTNFGRHTVLKNAFLFVDPVIYGGDRSAAALLSGSAMEDYAINETFQFYTPYGTWQDEVREPDDDHIELDTENPMHYPEDYAVVNGINSDHHQPTREGFLNDAVYAHDQVTAARKAAARQRRTQRAVLRDFIELDPHSSFPQSKLQLSYTPESMLAEELVEQEAEEYDPVEIFAEVVAQDSLLHPDSRWWADIDEEDRDDGHNGMQAVDVETVSTSAQVTAELDPEASLVIAGDQGLPLASIASADKSATMESSDCFIPGLVEIHSDSVAQDENNSDSESAKDEVLGSKVTYVDDDYVSEDDLFGMSFREEYKGIHGRSPPESPSKDPSPKTSSEEPSSEEDSPCSEGLSPVPSLEVRRLTSDVLRAVSGDCATPTEDGIRGVVDCTIETPESVEKIVRSTSAYRVVSDPGTSSANHEGRMFGVFKEMSAIPKRRTPRSPAIHDLSAVFNEGLKGRDKARKAVATLSEIREKDGDVPESRNTPVMKRSKSLSDIKKEFRDFHNIPGLDEKPLDRGLSINSYDPKTPVTKRKWNARQASIAQMTPIQDEEPVSVTEQPKTPAGADYSDIMMMTPDPSPPPSLPSDSPEIGGNDTQTEIGGAVVQQTYRVSTHNLPRPTPNTPPIRRQLRSSPLSTRIGVFNGPLAPHQHFFSDFDGAWEYTAQRFSGSSYSDPLSDAQVATESVSDAIALAAPSPDDVVTQPLRTPTSTCASDRPSLTKRVTSRLFGHRRETPTPANSTATTTNEPKPKGFLRKCLDTLTRRR